MTRRRSSNAAALAVCALALVCARVASAQTADPEEASLRAHYGASRWTTGPLYAGVAVARLVVPGLQLRARVDRLASDGGISLSFGGSVTTLRVQIAVASDAPSGRDALFGFLRTSQADLVPLASNPGADVALGDSPAGRESVAALWGNVAVSVERTRDAGAETPDASHV